MGGGALGVTASDELHKYGDEYWLYMSGGNALGTPIFVGFEPFSPPATRQLDPDRVQVSDDYLRIDIKPSTRSGVITVLKVRVNHFLGVMAGDVIRFQGFNKNVFWYNQGTGPANIGTMQGWNGYEDQGTFNLTRGAAVYSGTGDYEHLWGYNIVNSLYKNTDLLYEQWGIIVTNLYSGVIWEYRNSGGTTWQDGGIRFLDDGSYAGIGTTFGGYNYQTTDGPNCGSFSMTIGSTRGVMEQTLSGLRPIQGTGCRRQFGTFTVSGTIGNQSYSGWGLFENQRVTPAQTTTTTTSATTTSTSTTQSTTSVSTTTSVTSTTATSTTSSRLPTTLSLGVSPGALTLGQTGTASGRLLDASGGAVGGRSITIQVSSDSVTWTNAVKVTTAPDGFYSVSGTAKARGVFFERAVFAGDGQFMPITSPIVQYTVA